MESYGENSRCFEHTVQMWEERSCGHVRTWRHWGSGCYQYDCEGGRLNIVVGNYTYTCYYPGQPITIRIVRDQWLHKGAIMCPPCNEMCGTRLAMLGKHCKGSEEAPPSSAYPRDELKCDGCAIISQSSHQILTMFVILFYVGFS